MSALVLATGSKGLAWASATYEVIPKGLTVPKGWTESAPEVRAGSIPEYVVYRSVAPPGAGATRKGSAGASSCGAVPSRSAEGPVAAGAEEPVDDGAEGTKNEPAFYSR